MKVIVFSMLSATILGGCCSKLECEHDPELVFADDFFDLVCGTYAGCYPDFDCNELTPGDEEPVAVDCEFDVEKAQACLDGEYSCDTTLDTEAITIPEECDEVFVCVDG